MTRRVALLAATVALGATTPAAAQQWALPSPFGTGARVALNAGGEAAVAWRGPDGVYAATGGAAGFGAATRLGPADQSAAAAEVGIDDAGNAIVVWETTRSVPTCGRCDPRIESTGVWLARRAPAGGFGPAQRLAGALDRVARPHLAMRHDGHIAVAWSDATGSVVVNAAGEQRRLAGALEVSSVAVSGRGEVAAGDLHGRVVTCPASGACDAPRFLPGAGDTSYYFEVRVAAGADGEFVVAYDDAGGIRVAERSPEGVWSAPVLVETKGSFKGAAFLGAAIADDGAATVTWLTSGNAQRGEHSLLHEAHWRDLGTIATSLVDPSGDVTNSSVSVAPAGDTAFAWGRNDQRKVFFGPTAAQIAVRRRDAATAGPPSPLTPSDSSHALGDTPSVAINDRGEIVSVWTDTASGLAHVQSRWLATDGARPVQTLATAKLPVIPPVEMYFATTSPTTVRPSRRGYVAVALRCNSTGGRACRGTVTLSRYGRRVGRATFSVGAGRVRRVSVRLARATQRLLARRGRLNVRVGIVTRGGKPDVSSRITLRRR